MNFSAWKTPISVDLKFTEMVGRNATISSRIDGLNGYSSAPEEHVKLFTYEPKTTGSTEEFRRQLRYCTPAYPTLQEFQDEFNLAYARGGPINFEESSHELAAYSCLTNKIENYDRLCKLIEI